MKIRNGFVSNSSSSSFIFTLKKLGKCECCGRDFTTNIVNELDAYDISFSEIIDGYFLDDDVLLQLNAEHKNKHPRFYKADIDNFDEEKLNLLHSKEVDCLVRIE